MIRKKRHYRWGRIGLLVATAILGTVSISFCRDILFSEPKYIEYHTVVNEGETVWDICSKINNNREDVRSVIYRTMQANHISDVGNVQPGTKLIVYVKESK